MMKPKHYFLRQNILESTDTMELDGHTEETAQFNWVDGVRFDRPLPVQTLLVDPAYGKRLPDFFDTTVPVMSARLVKVLRDAGASNIDTYAVQLQNKVSGETYPDYFAVNVIGMLDAIDPARSPHETWLGDPEYSGPIWLNDAVAGDLPAFRLTNGPSFIVVSAALAALIEAEAFVGLLLQPTEAYDGD